MSLRSVIERSAAPATVAVSLERLTETYPGVDDRLEADPSLRDALVAVMGASRSMTELCLTEPAALDVLADLTDTPLLDPDSALHAGVHDAAGLRRWKRLEMLRIAARDLLGVDDLPVVGRRLAALAGAVLETAWAIVAGSGSGRQAGPQAGAPRLAVVGMGKLGGSELNYASDVDVMFVAGDDVQSAGRAAREVMEVARACFRVDANLRPEGRDGPLARSLESYRAYWDRWAQTWEFQALLKARPVAGDAALGQQFLAAAQERLWSRPFTPDDLRAVRTMKARAEGQLARKGLSEREVKRGRGGIRDIEFAVQLLQLVHGRHDPALRSPTTLDALAELAAAGYVDVDDARALDHAYRFLRTVEHRLQLYDEQQVHTVPTDEAARTRLARVMGYRDTAEAKAGQLLDEYLRRQQAAVRSIHERLFFRPLLDTLTTAAGAAPVGAAMPREAVVDRLAAFGFTDAERTRQALVELTRGLTRSSRLMQQMLPLLLQWLSESPDPDLGLLGLRRLSSGPQRATALSTAFREAPETARRLCLLVGTSRLLAETLEHHPDLIPALGEGGGPAPRTTQALRQGAATALDWRSEPGQRQKGLQRYQRREVLRIAARDVLDLHDAGEDPVVATARELTALAEACVGAALATVDPAVPFAVVAMGRFGGGELSYASDLDVLFVYEGSTADDFSRAEEAATALVRFLSGATPAARVYPVDAGLRPEGKDGPLARSLDGYRSYYERWVQVWELQALLRARPVAGDPDVGRRFMELIEPFVGRDHLPEEDRREIRRIKARVERERIPAGEDPQFHLKLGRGSLSDVEFTAQLLQLEHGVRSPATMEALDRLTEAGALAADDKAVLADAYRFCERTRNRWFLIKGSPGDSLPSQPEQLGRLARSLDTTPTELREHYRRVTRRARQVVERLFYGKS